MKVGQKSYHNMADKGVLEIGSLPKGMWEVKKTKKNQITLTKVK